MNKKNLQFTSNTKFYYFALRWTSIIENYKRLWYLNTFTNRNSFAQNVQINLYDVILMSENCRCCCYFCMGLFFFYWQCMWVNRLNSEHYMRSRYIRYVLVPYDILYICWTLFRFVLKFIVVLVLEMLSECLFRSFNSHLPLSSHIPRLI